MPIIYEKGHARLEGWGQDLSKKDLIEVVRQLEERNRELERAFSTIELVFRVTTVEGSPDREVVNDG